MQQLWTEQFFPKDLKDFLGNSEIVEACIKWGEAWENGKEEKPLLFVGPNGIGKTALALLVARHFDWQVFELNASDFRDKETVEKVVFAAAVNRPLFGGRRLVFLDEIDCLSGNDRGGSEAILKVLKESKNPVILTANDVYSNQKLIGIREYCHRLEFKKINFLSMAKRFREILFSQEIPFEEEAVKELARKSDGDFRGALLDLQSHSYGGNISMQDVSFFDEREKQANVFKVMSKIFNSRNLKEVREAVFYSQVNHDMLTKWVEENIPIQFDAKDSAVAFNFLSRANVYDGRIFNRQYYGFLRYSTDLMVLGVNSSKSHEYTSFTPFRFPSLLSKLSRSIGERELKKSIAKKIGQKTHSSFRKVLVFDLPFYRQLLEDRTVALDFLSSFELSEKEAAYLLGVKPDSKKFLEFYSQLQESKSKKPLVKIEEKIEVKKSRQKKEEEKKPKQQTLF